MAYINMGDRFNSLIATEPCLKSRDKIIFKCDCGKQKEILGQNVKLGNSTSCGCIQKARVIEASRTHGQRKSKIYSIHHDIVNRCTNPKDLSYKNYGGRGIEVCERWKVFENFYEDMGDVPNGMQIDRIDNELGYSKSNCRWISPRDNSNNRRSNHVIDIDGEAKTVSYWAEDPRVSVAYSTILTRLNRGWSNKEALFTPPLKKGTRTKK